MGGNFFEKAMEWGLAGRNRRRTISIASMICPQDVALHQDVCHQEGMWYTTATRTFIVYMRCEQLNEGSRAGGYIAMHHGALTQLLDGYFFRAFKVQNLLLTT